MTNLPLIFCRRREWRRWWRRRLKPFRQPLFLGAQEWKPPEGRRGEKQKNCTGFKLPWDPHGRATQNTWKKVLDKWEKEKEKKNHTREDANLPHPLHRKTSKLLSQSLNIRLRKWFKPIGKKNILQKKKEYQPFSQIFGSAEDIAAQMKTKKQSYF